MNLRFFHRMMLLIPLLGIFMAASFVSVPAANAQIRQASVQLGFEVCDPEVDVPQTYIHTQIPEQEICRSRKFYSRGRAVSPASILGSTILTDVRNAQHTGLYVLHHADAQDEVPTSSQYSYLFLLTPF